MPRDVTDSGAVTWALDTFVQQTGRLDTLFNNASIFIPAAPIDEVSVDDWLRAINVNLTGMFLCARAAFGAMRARDPQGGQIINNGSISAHAPREGEVIYTANKHGITGLTKPIALDGRAFNIAASQIDIENAQADLLNGIIQDAVATGLTALPSMEVSYVSHAIWNMVNLPLHANTLFQTIVAMKMPFVARG